MIYAILTFLITMPLGFVLGWLCRDARAPKTESSLIPQRRKPPEWSQASKNGVLE